MEIYTLLGVTKDATIDEIRAAYTKKLKEIDMSRDLEGYQNLRKAYNQAIKDAGSSTSSFSYAATSSAKPEAKTVLPNKQEIPNEPIDRKTAPKKEIVEALKKRLEKIESNPPVTDSKTTVPKNEIPKKANTSEISFVDHFNSFLAQKEFYNSFAKWEEFLDLFLVASIQTKIATFLLDNFMLLDDSTRFQLVKYCDINEGTYQTPEEKAVFTNQIQQQNFLEYNFYTYIPKDSRNVYFKLRYKLYQIIQTEKPKAQLSSEEFSKLKKSNYQDYDFDYLLSVYSLIVPDSLTYSEIHERLSEIDSDKYNHDVAILNNYLDFLVHPVQGLTTSAAIISLSWVSDTVKEKLIDRLKGVKEEKQKATSVPLKRSKESVKPAYKPYKPMNSKKIILLIVIGLVILFSLLSILFARGSSHSTFSQLNELVEDNNWENLDDGSIEESIDFDYLTYKLENRVNNVKLNYNIYSYLIWESDFNDEYNALSLQTISFITDFRKANAKELDGLEVSDFFNDIKETHDLDTEGNLVTYSQFIEDANFSFKAITNANNEIISMESINPDIIAAKKDIGTADASLFFTEDLADNSKNLDVFLGELEETYSAYIEDDVYERIKLIDDNTYTFLTDFAYSKPHLIKDNLIAFVSYENKDLLAIELGDDLKISQIYGEYFDPIPVDVAGTISKLSANEDYNSNWYYELGIK